MRDQNTTRSTPTTKICTKCGQEKPLAEFYNNKKAKDGKTFRCKSCMNTVNEKYRKDNPEKVKETRRKTKKKAKSWYHEYGGKEYMRKYSATEKVKAKKKVYARTPGAVKLQNARQRRQYAREPEKALARIRLHREIRMGRFTKASEHLCAQCGAPAQEWHHLSYYRWDDVIPLCEKHHHEIHKRE